MSKENLTSMNKRTVRKKVLSLRRKISGKRKKEAAQKALQTLFSIVEKYPKVLSFAPTKNELDLWPLNHRLLEAKKLVLPKISEDTLNLYTVENFSTLQPHAQWKILEPASNAHPVALTEIKIALVPALAFDDRGHRLGHGLGYYDRFLKEIAYAYTIGVGFKESFSKEPLPIESHDIALKAVLLF